MGDSYSDHQTQGRNFDSTRERRGNFRGGRGPGNREPGGFRIRLSDNEMRYARNIQEAFNLRSTVAVLGFALRTLGEMLEKGKLNELIDQTREQNTNQNNRDGQENRNENRRNNFSNNTERPNPFARPEKPEQTNSSESSNENEENSNNNNSEQEEAVNSIEQNNQEDIKTDEAEETSESKETSAQNHS